MSDIKLDALAIAAHRDDVEITCGGLLLKLHDLGYKTGVLDFTEGEMGTRGTKEERAEEAANAAKLMGVSVRENLHLPDGNVQLTRENVIKVAAFIRRHRPHLVILPNEDQRHPDHYWCYRIGREACYFSGLSKLECEGEPYRPFKVLYSPYYRDVVPTFYVDISDQFERKIETVKCYRSQFEGTGEKNQIFVKGIDVFDFLQTQDHAAGQKIHKGYAEGYIVMEPLEVEDPIKLLVASV